MASPYPLSLDIFKTLSVLDMAPPSIFRWVYRSSTFYRSIDLDDLRTPRDASVELQSWQRSLDRLLADNLKRSKAEGRRMSPFASVSTGCPQYEALD